MSKSFYSTDFINRNKKNSNAIFQFNYINHILTSHSNFEFLRRSLNVVLNNKILTQVEQDLKQCLHTETFHVLFYLKKRYRKVINKSVEMMKQSLKRKEKRKTINKFIDEKSLNLLKKIVIFKSILS